MSGFGLLDGLNGAKQLIPSIDSGQTLNDLTP